MLLQSSKPLEDSRLISQALLALGLMLTALFSLSAARGQDELTPKQPAPSPTGTAVRTLKIEPSEIRPNGILTITTDSALTIEPTAISVGGVGATLQDPSVGTSTIFRVKLAAGTPIGQQAIVIAAKDGLHFGSVLVNAVIDSVKTTAETGTGVLTGGSITVQTLGTLPQGNTSLTVRMTPQEVAASPSASPTPIELKPLTVKDNQITVTIPDDVSEGRHRIEVISSPDAAPLNVSGSAFITVHSLWPCFGLAISPVIIVGLIVIGLCALPTPKKRSPTGKRYRWFDVLFLEEENNTYSLSRAQFVAWLAAITTAYVFLFITRGLIDNTWVFPPLAGFAYTFLLSLGTLVAAQGANSLKGFKGAGSMDPKLADLVLNGDVLALDRVQQLVWTIISIGIFLWITFRSYANSNALPTVPQEMLTLMGISSAGYLAGKFVRKPGPIIQQITSDVTDSIKIFGENLSRDAFVWIDGAQVAKDAVSVSEVEPSNPSEFAKALLVKLILPAQATAGAATSLWRTKSHNIAVVNSDGQRAEWAVIVPQVSAATATQAGSQFTISITGIAIMPSAAAEAWNPVSNIYVTISQFKPQPGPVDPNITMKWTGTTDFKPTKVRITNPDNQRAEVDIG